MPEVRFTLRWPDGSEDVCYSPSTVITRFFTVGESYALPDFLTRARIGYEKASMRVAERYGYACTAAMAELDRLEARAAAFEGQEGATIACTAMSQ
ncbi:MSMEG_0570 family nitrogen starvation response protein [Oceanicella sp. SM1341]|uniref:MSMEG_0570 family nitrogen starvation response protein n=1 Tax=Oceanicella sp. SM1341 TaxID=1548889 RepID=UPI000E4EA435|nr:MSMEG_0570 family nitrogen starvation response protein [Oceanicella sp. SM1341]